MTYEQLLLDLALANPEIVVLTAENRAVIRGLPAQLGQRFIDVGICEQTMIGAAAGLALRGRIPVVHALAAFLLLRAYEFIRTDVGIARLPVKLVGYVPGFLSTANGPTHQAIEDIALMRGIPGMQVFCPADRDELVNGLPALIDSAAPCYVRYNDSAPAVVHSTEPFEIGRAEVLSAGGDVALVTYGFLLEQASRARDLLEDRGVTVRLINLRTLQPIDEQVLLAAASETRLIVTIEDHFRVGGLYSILAELLLRSRLSAPVLPIALEQRWFKPLLLPELLRVEEFTAEQIASRVLDGLNIGDRLNR